MNQPQASSGSSNSLTVFWEGIATDAQTGASPIMSYGLEYKTGAGAWTTLQGDPTDSLNLSYIINGLVAGQSYSFRVRAKNEFGWGPYSNESSFIPRAVPSKMDPVVTVIDNIYVKISWTQPNENGAVITRYLIEIANFNYVAFAESPNCDGNEIQTFSDKYCLVLMSELIDPLGNY